MAGLSTPRARLAIVGLAAAGVLGVLAVSGLNQDLVYYRTPSEAAADADHADRLRLGGMVLPGSLHRDGDVTRFALTDGAADVPVEYSGTTTAVFAEGQGAVVEGTLDAAGLFHADSLLVKHSNEYTDGNGGVYRPPTTAQ